MKWRMGSRGLGVGVSSAIVLLLALPNATFGSDIEPEALLRKSATPRTSDVATSSSEEEYDRFLRSITVFYHAVNKENASLMAQSAAVSLHRYKQLPLSDAVSMEGLQALGEQLTLTKRSIAVANPDKQRLKTEAASLLLAAEAMANPSNPLWYDYRTVLAEDLSALRDTLSRGEDRAGREADTISAGAAVSRLQSHYEAIRTAALFNTAPLVVMRSDNVLRYASIVIGSESSNLALAQGAIRPLSEAMFAMFPGPSDRQSAVVPAVPGASWGWTAMMGSFIVTVLTWVGWRRYKDEDVAGMKSKRNGETRKDAAESLLQRWRNSK